MTNISVRKSTACIVVFLSAILTTSPCLADTIYSSKSGTLMVRYGNKCSTVKPSGFYRFGSISGNLIALSCENLGGDGAEHNGLMQQVWGRRTFTTWIIEGAVSGYRCLQSGKKFRVEMDDGKQI
jgi:hypothetical protein